MRLALALTVTGALVTSTLPASPAMAGSAPVHRVQAAAHSCVDVVGWDTRDITRYVTLNNRCSTTQCVAVSQPFARDAVVSVRPGVQEVPYSSRLLPQGKGVHESDGCT